MMKELKKWINNLPDDFEDFSLVCSKVEPLDEKYETRFDMPIIRFFVDEINKEICLQVSKD